MAVSGGSRRRSSGGGSGSGSSMRGGGASPGINYAAVCASASGIPVRAGFERLGPVRGFGDVLLSAGSSDFGAQLAAEQISHFVEGWRYAAASVNSYMNNSKAGAIHFAYYAELRAALSLLCWSGIRVRQGEYFYLDASGGKNPMSNGRTHTAVWMLWDEWVRRSDARDLFLMNVRVSAGLKLGDVVRGVGFVDPSSQLRGWGSDLISLGDDHSARNDASYEPFWRDRALEKIGQSENKLVADLWRLFTPDGVGVRFDTALAQSIVEKTLSGAVAGGGVSEGDFFNRLVVEISAATGEKKETVSSVLRNRGDVDLSVFDLAASRSVEAENVLCRAFFLLRISMLALDSSLVASRTSDAASWLRNWLDHAGIWTHDSGCDPVDISDDYMEALDEFSENCIDCGTLWSPENLKTVVRMARPDACVAWNVHL